MLFGLFLVHSLQDFFVKKKAMVPITSNTAATANTILANWWVFVQFYKEMSLNIFFPHSELLLIPEIIFFT